MRRTGKTAVEGPGRADSLELSLRRLRSVLAHLAPGSLLRAGWRRPEEAVEPRVRRLVSDTLAVDARELTREVSLVDDLAVDSLDFAELAIAVEEEFRVTFPEILIDDLRTYGDLVSRVQLAVRELHARQAAAESERPPPFIWARVRPPEGRPTGTIERTGWLTPYTVETIVDSALRAGPGARLEVAVPPTVGNRALMRIRAELAWLDRRHIGVDIHRDPELSVVGSAA